MKTVRPHQLRRMLPAPYTGNDAAVTVLEPLVEAGLGEPSLRIWIRGLFQGNIDFYEAKSIIEGIVQRLEKARGKVSPRSSRQPIDTAMDWGCLADNVRLLASLDHADHVARLHMRRNKQELLDEVAHGLFTVNLPSFMRCAECSLKAKQGQCGAPASTHLCRRRHGLMPKRSAAFRLLFGEKHPGQWGDASGNLYHPTTWVVEDNFGNVRSRGGYVVLNEATSILDKLASEEVTQPRQRLLLINREVERMLVESGRPTDDFFRKANQQGGDGGATSGRAKRSRDSSDPATDRQPPAERQRGGKGRPSRRSDADPDYADGASGLNALLAAATAEEPARRPRRKVSARLSQPGAFAGIDGGADAADEDDGGDERQA